MGKKPDRIKVIEAAETHLRAGKIPEAIAEYKKVLEEWGPDSHISNTIGDLNLRLGKDDQAITAFQEAALGYEEKGSFSRALAIYKKIARLSPDDRDTAAKMAALFSQLGFTSDAKNEYLRLARWLEEEGSRLELIALYKKLRQLDEHDLSLRIKLAELYTKDGALDEALEELRDVASILVKSGDLKEAAKILGKARKLKEYDSQTIGILVELYKKENKKKEALALVEECLQAAGDSPELLLLLGNLHWEAGRKEKAEQVFLRLFNLNPLQLDARIKLCSLMIQRENLDKAFELFEPLISNLIGKNKEGRAIGLLGLVLQAPQVHIPALEKLAFIYRLMDQKGNLELALRVLLKEFREKGLKEKRLNVLKELRELRPSDQEIEKEYSLLRKEYGVFDQLDIEDKVALLSSQDQEVISQNLKRVDECVREGKIRSARQILENLQILYPSERQIARRIALVDEIPPEVAVEEAPPFVEIPAARGRGPVIPENVETDEVVFKGKTKDFFDLNLPIAEEKMAMDAAFDEQVKDKAESVGKELKEIAAQFQKAPEEKDDKISSEARYNLGIALLEQEMYEDAIQELRLAAKDPDRAADCLGMVSHCYRRLAKPQEAVKWIRQAIQLSRQGSPQFFALKYDMASLYEEMKDWPKALSLYQEVLAWDSTYKNTSQKVEALKKSSRDSRS